ncbi:MAG: hypothetical protein OEM63_05445 [Gammaproteobacteria bacterium]|nr:hypothetical protein [Gammaproteobacteria bacterium]
MIHESILRYRKGRFLWWAVLLVILSVALYTTQGGSQPANGGTWQGYVLGTLGALLIVWLAMLGVRKRQYASTVGTVPAWTSAHVYLGAALLVVATLHSAGQLGWNVHSLSYVLMFLVILSGFYGIYTYINYPQAMTANRSNASRAQLFAELFELDNRGRELAARAPEEINAAVISAIERTGIGGGIYSQLLGRDQSLFVPPGSGGKTASNRDQQPVIDLVATRIPRASKVAEAELLEELLEVFCRRQAVLRRIAFDIRLRGRIRFWLLIHVPLTVALLVALVVHIVTTFIYW